MKTKRLIAAMMIVSSSVVGMAQTQLESGIDLTNMDLTANPATDFYQYATGGWQKKNPLPAAYSRYGSFDQLQEDNNKRINGILSDLLKNTYPEGSIERKLSDFYKLAMDSTRRDKEGVAPVTPLLKKIEAVKSVPDFKKLQMQYAAFSFGVPFDASFNADERNASMNILYLYQGGLTLGQKEYYLDTDKATVDIREAYKKHLIKMFQLFGFNAAQAKAKGEAVLRFETALAKFSKSSTELRDVEANYNKMTLAQFKAKYPNLPVEALLNAEGVKSAYFQSLVVGQPTFFAGLNKLVTTWNLADRKAYMQWSVINSSTGYLSSAVEAEHFDFFGKTMRGKKENFPLWKRATSQVESVMGEALGRIYCERFFPASSKTRMEELVKNLQVALAERIKDQDWMTAKTKEAALDKLNSFYVKIGYPNKWKDMSGLSIKPSESYYDNVMQCVLYWNNKTIEEKAGKPVDKDEWLMTPQTVNAYYNPTTNEICFPAGILQRPFFDPKADDAFNYGAIGVVIGHEMTHGFDDQGRHYDKNGNMRDWWTADDAKNFDARATEYANFFSNIKVLPDLNANGRFTLGENLADHGGLEVAFAAFENVNKKEKLPIIDGLTPEQRFFIAYSGVWAGNITEKEIRSRTKSDPHSLGQWRVNGALPHINAWYKAFGVKEGDALFLPESKRLKLW
ncbi:MAG: M13 family metallopeptidase [Prevotella nanceiensis]|uniref:M13 family metallopeptidase n=1 Tax=Hoylesella nanceiensis TaxID=425941 RepID=UPI001CB5C129|nr:M13 family metallopeptidase [Hoylesella nanceiensis]MBF1438439.1 M13 family metallopeptidase [Hoylesella nanceiensis]